MIDQFKKRTKPLARVPHDSLMVHEIYASIQGESTYAGIPCVFVRTTACHLRCTYCDTKHAFGHGEPLTQEQVLVRVRSFGLTMVEFTGGEPLLQPAVLPLMRRLCDEGYTVLLETSGSLDVSAVDERVVRIVDLKTPSSGELAANLYTNLGILTARDEVKFVLGHREDYEWAKQAVRDYDLSKRCKVLFGTVFGELDPQHLAEWIVEDKLAVRMQLQIHKYIWHPEARGV